MLIRRPHANALRRWTLSTVFAGVPTSHADDDRQPGTALAPSKLRDYAHEDTTAAVDHGWSTNASRRPASADRRVGPDDRRSHDQTHAYTQAHDRRSPRQDFQTDDQVLGWTAQEWQPVNDGLNIGSHHGSPGVYGLLLVTILLSKRRSKRIKTASQPKTADRPDLSSCKTSPDTTTSDQAKSPSVSSTHPDRIHCELCGAELSSTDLHAGACTQCAAPLPQTHNDFVNALKASIRAALSFNH